MSKKAALIVLDGFGIAPNGEGNAVYLANTPFIDNLITKYGSSKLKASGTAVGLEENQMGDSNVGHLNLGAGRVVWQMLPKMNKAIQEGALQESQVLKDAIINSQKNNKPLHLMGLVSDGGVHSHMGTLRELLREISSYNIQVRIHAFLDGRDVPPKSAKKYIETLQDWLLEFPFAKIATLSGRYYAMDRDNRWERTELALTALVNGEGTCFEEPIAAIESAYKNELTDEFIKPSVICKNGEPKGKIGVNDTVIFFNFRADRARQITKLLLEKGVKIIGMTNYDDDFSIPIIFPQEEINNTLAEWLSKNDKTQLHIAETEKYAHVTFFFNGGSEIPFEGEDRVLIDSPKVATYDLQPEMSAFELTKQAIEAIDKNNYDFIILNYANCDMVGHTGNIEAAIKAVEAVDKNLARLIPFLINNNYEILVTADHGNAEKMLLEGKPHTAHTSNLVPLIAITSENFLMADLGKLGDIAPTILDLMEIDKPIEMTGNSLVDKER